MLRRAILFELCYDPGMDAPERKTGRPVSPLPRAVCERFLEWIASGRTLRAFARAEGISESVLYRWTEKDEEFRKDVRAARTAGHDSLAAEMLDIADSATPETVGPDRLRCDVRRWLLSRWSPERYGDAKASGESGATVVVVTGVPRDSVDRNTVERNTVERKTTPTPGRSPLAASRAGGEEHNTSNTHIPPNTPTSQPRVTVEIDPPIADDPL